MVVCIQGNICISSLLLLLKDPLKPPALSMFLGTPISWPQDSPPIHLSQAFEDVDSAQHRCDESEEGNPDVRLLPFHDVS